MATLDYCAFENTAADMVVAFDKLQNLDGDLADLDPAERRGLKQLFRLSRQLVETIEHYGWTEQLTSRQT